MSSTAFVIVTPQQIQKQKTGRILIYLLVFSIITPPHIFLSPSLEMASIAKISYQRLRNEGGFDDVGYVEERSGRVIGRAIRSWSRRYGRVKIRRKVKIRIPNLKKFLRRKRKVIVGSWSKVFKRLKESRSQFGDLFAGNYLFMQVTPTSFKYVDKPHHLNLHDFSSRYHLPRISRVNGAQFAS